MSSIFYKISELDKVSEIIIQIAKSKIVCLYGEMGSGKTTLIKELVRKLGSSEIASSPTFGIVHGYRNSSNELIAYHFDLYRLESMEEALDMGIDEYLQEDSWIFIEWPGNIKELLPTERTEIHLRVVGSDTRELTIRNLGE